VEHVLEELGRYSATELIAPVGTFFAILAGGAWLAVKVSEDASDSTKQAAWGTFAVLAVVMFLVNWPSAFGVGKTQCENLRRSDPAEYAKKHCGVIYPDPASGFTMTSSSP
jgi:membrane protein implicated in regulation of membrane protease activity